MTAQGCRTRRGSLAVTILCFQAARSPTEADSRPTGRGTRSKSRSKIEVGLAVSPRLALPSRRLLPLLLFFLLLSPSPSPSLYNNTLLRVFFFSRCVHSFILTPHPSLFESRARPSAPLPDQHLRMPPFTHKLTAASPPTSPPVLHSAADHKANIVRSLVIHLSRRSL